MQISVPEAINQTWLFISVLFIFLLISFKKRSDQDIFPASLTTEIKGFAILAIVLSHIGYFLSYDHDFLYPLSVLAGVGVNLFLFLSGFGLTLSSLKTPQSVLGFFKKRLINLFIPLWIILIFFYLVDLFILNLSYPTREVVKSFLGIFTQAEIYTDLNSPLWYFSLILFYYLIFPFLFLRKFLYFTPFLIVLVNILFLKYQTFLPKDMVDLYFSHILAFPMGILFALGLQEKKFENIFRIFLETKPLIFILRSLLLIILAILITQTAIYSGVGKGINQEQAVAMVTTVALLLFFIFKKVEFRFLTLIGVFSYEIYLIHWPILYRHGFLYQLLPAWIATILYLIIFLSLGLVLQKLSANISNLKLARKI